MKINISRQYIYLMLLSLVLFIFVLIFSFSVLIPQGKEYRVKRLELKKVSGELRVYEDYHSETLEKLQDLRSKNRATITAFERAFNPDRFEKQNKKYFSSLKISQIATPKAAEEVFSVYEVNTSSQISSPKNFYNFLEVLKKSDWIIEVTFPIDFKRSGEMIESSFEMRVYANNKESNETVASSDAK